MNGNVTIFIVSLKFNMYHIDENKLEVLACKDSRMIVRERTDQQIGGYRLVHLLEQSGSSEVYLAEHREIKTIWNYSWLGLMRLLSWNILILRVSSTSV